MNWGHPKAGQALFQQSDWLLVSHATERLIPTAHQLTRFFCGAEVSQSTTLAGCSNKVMGASPASVQHLFEKKKKSKALTNNAAEGDECIDKHCSTRSIASKTAGHICSRSNITIGHHTVILFRERSRIIKVL